MKPSVLILTLNEEIHLRSCLESVAGWARDIFVLDSNSTDGTVALARQYTPHVFFRSFDSFSAQRNWAMRRLPFGSPWLLVLDADEIVPPELAAEISALEPAPGLDAYRLRFRVIYEGVWIRRSSLYPTWITRLLRHEAVEYESREVNAHPRVRGGIGRLRHDLLHWNRKGVHDFLVKHNQYTTFEAREYLRDVRAGGGISLRTLLRGPAASRRREMKRVAMRLPGRALLKFLYVFLLRGGVLDGPPGWRYCLLLAMNEFCVGLKLRELTRPPGATTPFAGRGRPLTTPPVPEPESAPPCVESRG